MENYNGDCGLDADTLALVYCHDHNSACRCDYINSDNFVTLYNIRGKLNHYIYKKKYSDNLENIINITKNFNVYQFGTSKSTLYVSKNVPFAVHVGFHLWLDNEPQFYQSHILNIPKKGYADLFEAKKRYIQNHGI
jgi:hypothetical protein